jgi:hypothetical protein
MLKLEPTRPREPWVPEWVNQVLAARERFAASLRRSRKGNLWRRLPTGETVSVFPRAEASWSYSVADERGVRYSKADYASEQEAVAALAAELGVE